MPKRLTSRFTHSTPQPQPQASSSHIPSTFTDGLPLPTIFVFDLDYTLWPFWVDTHVSSPIKPANKDSSQNTAMLDRYGESFSFYHEVPGILHAARQKNITMGLASRTCAPDLAEKMLRGIFVPVPQTTTTTATAADDDTTATKTSSNEKPTKAWDYFTHREIYPGSKIKHFNRIQNGTRKQGTEIPFADMIFFDDEGRNREVETQLGVTFVLVRDGVTRDEVDHGVREWRRRRGISAVPERDGNGDGGRDASMEEDES